jgi:hypothetical protein
MLVIPFRPFGFIALKLYLKRVVCTNFDIYVFVEIFHRRRLKILDKAYIDGELQYCL